MTPAPPGGTTPGHRSAGARLTIGKVLDRLRGDFPDISPSKVRFLEAEGLVTPERTPAGYRTYSESDVERLRYILVAQRERYWPLKVIRDALDALDRGLDDPGTGAGLPRPPAPLTDPEVPGPERLRPGARVWLTREEVRRATGLDEPVFTALETFGLLQPSDSGHFDESALAVAAAARTLGEHGLEPRHLRPFRTAADREIGLVEQVLATRRGGGREERAAQILSACIALHVALVRSGLSR
ncbi:MAG TPA: MerR family transcriptional regulator [Intrasporangium sp.]|uniref:transcriptional regulator FtsR n=1 Tax=Intrasporangium sp. TaxID=1925024 RepID=UPI002D766092|nr:MerR family transcriptional regulator [Intrasporangium sp.]HET7397697.1 MerR family transcriptional regulator [Intrasporangium sp.]